MRSKRRRAIWLLASALVASCALQPAVAWSQPAHDADRDVWYTISSGDVVFGSVHSVQRVQPDGTRRLTENTRMLVNLFGQRQETTESLDCVVGPSLEPVSFQHRSQLQSGVTTAEGRMMDDELVIDIRGVGGTLTRRIPLSKHPLLGVCLAEAIAKRQLRIGESVEIAVLSDSWSLQTITATRLDDAEGLRRYAVDAKGQPGHSTLSLAEDGLLESVTRVLPDRQIRRATAEAAQDLSYFTFSNRELLVFPLDKEVTFPERAKRIVVKLAWKDLPFEKLQLEDSRQKIAQQSHEQDRYDVDLVLGQPVAIEHPAPFPVADESLAKYLEETSFIRPHDPAIREHAQRWTAGATNSLEAARRLSHEVSNYLQGGEMIVETLSGPEVLACRKGKCAEFTTLYASLARSLGIPTRVALGMRLVSGMWAGHMWCEVWVGQWIPVDASADEVGGSPALLKLAHSRTVMGTQSVRWEMTRTLELNVIDFVPGESADLGLETGIVRNVYTNADFACRLAAPNDWTLEDQSKPGAAIIRLKPPGTSENPQPLVHFLAFNLPTKLAPSVLINIRKARAASAVKDFKDIEDTKVTIAGATGHRVTYSHKNAQGQTLKVTEVLWTGEGAGFLLNLVADETTHDALLPQFDATVKGFESLRPVPPANE